jgi:hypothetical protein
MSTLTAFANSAPAIVETPDNPDFKSSISEESFADPARLQRPLTVRTRF